MSQTGLLNLRGSLLDRDFLVSSRLSFVVNYILIFLYLPAFLKHLCRFEKGDTARRLRKDAKPKIVPNPEKGIKIQSSLEKARELLL